MDKKFSGSERSFCTTCGGGVSAEWRYCPQCGAGFARTRAGSARMWTDIGLGAAVVVALMLSQIRNGHPAEMPMAASAVPFASAMPAVSSIPAPAPPRTRVSSRFTLPASSWIDTGIDVPPGGSIDIEASGQWNPWTGTMPMMGPDGYAREGDYDVVCREATWGSLVGRIGDGPYMPVGSRSSLMSSTGGRLFLGINDDYNSQATNDNTGSLNVTVRGDGSDTGQVSETALPSGPHREARTAVMASQPR